MTRSTPITPAALRRTVEAIRHLESTVTGAQGIEGVILRSRVYKARGPPLVREAPC